MIEPHTVPIVTPAAVGPAAASAASTVAFDEPAGDTFDRERVLRVLDQLEHDVSAVEAAMEYAEKGDHEAFRAAVATISALDAV